MIAIEKHSLEAVLRIGEVTAVEGQKIIVRVDKNKNSSDLFYQGEILKNVSVNSFIEIRKGFLSIIGRVEGEKIDVDPVLDNDQEYQSRNKNRRFLTVSLVGFINHQSLFTGGLRELPLIGNEAYLLTNDKLAQVHNLVQDEDNCIKIAKNDHDDLEIALPINGLFNSHIAIFGNTGSGKSNTTAALYKALFEKLETMPNNQSKFVFIDFNGEYTRPDCLTQNKKIYDLDKNNDENKVPFKNSDLLNVNVLALLTNATEKTQRPFLRRVIEFFEKTEPIQGELNQLVLKALTMKQNAGKVFDLLEYFSALLDKPYKEISSNIKVNFSDLNHNSTTISEENISATFLHKACENFELPEQSQFFDRLLKCLYFQLITDILSQRVQQDHIITCINLFSSIKPELEKVIKLNEISEDTTNVTIINLKCVSDQNIKKIIPLLVCKKLYEEQKSKKPEDRQSLTFIIDEAHNILSNESFREAESWRDYRLETFEEIIKEGRKFGVFVTISSQRPSDISETITSQAHNYFIHRLINQKDLVMISKAVSYIDKITESSIPVLPTGTCIFSGIATQLPLKLKIDRLSDECQPHSDTFKYTLVTD